jgi:hypothetical protein
LVLVVLVVALVALVVLVSAHLLWVWTLTNHQTRAGQALVLVWGGLWQAPWWGLLPCWPGS